MAETLVSLMTKLGWLAMREWIQPMVNLSQSIKDIMPELESTNTYLQTVDGFEETNILHEQFNREVRDLANQVEDALDDYILLCSESLQQNGFLFTMGTSLIRQTRNVGTRYKIAKTIEEIKPKFKAARERFIQFDNIRKASDGSSSSSSASKNQRDNPQNQGHLNKTLVGIEGPKAELIEKLVNEVQKLQVILVVGLGGMGKTTLVHNVFEDDRVRNHFKRHLWINLATDTNQEELLKEVIEMYCQESRQQPPERLETMNSRAMKQEIWRLLENERYLIILDDVRALEKWKAWFPVFPNKDNGSRVIITTQDTEVAHGSRDHVYLMKRLSKKDSKELFRLKAFGDESCPGHLLELQDRILKRCGGMPLGIEAIGSLLREKDKRVAEWGTIIDSLGTELQEDSLSDINTILLRCYHDTSYHLKHCLLYMSIFPEDHLIGHLKLIRLWVAEGFVTKCERKTADDVAEGYLSKLVSRCLIQVADRRSDGRVKSYRLHGLMRIILTTRAKDQNFVARNKTIDSYSKERRLSVQNSLNLRGTVSNLRSLLLFDVEKNLDKLTMPVLFDGKSKLLTVLDLEGANLIKFPSNITDMLNLRYLSLRNTKVKEIPSSIGRLQKLETLDLKRTRVRKLPREIKHLQQLQNLLLYQCVDDKNGDFPSKHGFQAPIGMGALTSLQKLCFVEASIESGYIVEELGELKELRRLGIVKLSTRHEAALWSSIQQMSQLRALSVTASIGETMDLQGLKSPPVCLERLYLTGTLKSFPKWTESPSLENLVKIFLKSSNMDKEPLDKLGNLKNLIHIELQQVYNGKEFRFRSDKFQKLKILGVRKNQNLDTVTIEENSMPKLEKLLFQDCGRLKTLPEGITSLLNLKVLDFVQMPGDLYSRMIHPSSAEFRSIQHIPQVSFATYEDQHWDIKRVSTLVKGSMASKTSANKLLLKQLNNFDKK